MYHAALLLLLAACGAPDDDADGWPAALDCDDADPAVSPGAIELCNAIDDDCDGAVDAGAADATLWYTDDDADGFGAAGSASIACDAPTGAVAAGTDCDDADPGVFPGGTELCDGQDDDCNGRIDDDAADEASFFVDLDRDGHGDPLSTVAACQLPAGAATTGDDCDDADPLAFPGAVEVCNLVDDDCDGTTDAGAVDATTWYADLDQDGWGDAAAATTACEPPASTALIDGDCDDGDPGRHPGHDERCDGQDEDCDGAVDEGAIDMPWWHDDFDADGFGSVAVVAVACQAPAGTLADGSDCDDFDPAKYPGADERCNAVDDNCDALVDGPDAVDPTRWYVDSDEDGYGVSAASVLACDDPGGYATLAGDCDDASGGVSPGRPEDCVNGLDDDCNGAADDCGPGGGDPWETVSAGVGIHWVGPSGTNAPDSAQVIGDIDGDGFADVAIGEGSVVGDGNGNADGGGWLLYGGPALVGSSFDALPTVRPAVPDYAFGSAVGPAGDVNVDGYADFWMTSIEESTQQSDAEGRAYLVFGGPVRVTEAAVDTLGVVFTETGYQYHLGSDATVAGDFDGDGYDDALLGEYQFGYNQSNGVARVVFGDPAGIAGAAAASLPGFAGEFADRVGDENSLSSGDIDGDGISDLLLGARNGGRAYLVYGDPVRPAGTVQLAASEAWFGGPWDYNDESYLGGATLAVDLDDDGYADPVVAGFNIALTASGAGAVYRFAGSAARFPPGQTDVSAASLEILGTSEYEYTGWDVAAADFDLDGVNDLAVSSEAWDQPGQDAGMVSVWLGTSGAAGNLFVTDADVRLQGEFGGNWFGNTLSTGDVTGDGVEDLLVGAPNAGGSSGWLYLISGTEL